MYFTIEINVTSVKCLRHVGLEDFLNWDELLYGGFNAYGETAGQFFISHIFTLLFVEDIWIFVQILCRVVVACLNKNFIGWKLETNFFVFRLETNRRKDLCTRNKDRCEEIIEPSASIRNVIGVLLRHGVGPVWHFLQQLLKHNEGLLSL